MNNSKRFPVEYEIDEVYEESEDRESSGWEFDETVCENKCKILKGIIRMTKEMTLKETMLKLTSEMNVTTSGATEECQHVKELRSSDGLLNRQVVHLIWYYKLMFLS